jgi:hypothetical protein
VPILYQGWTTTKANADLDALKLAAAADASAKASAAVVPMNQQWGPTKAVGSFVGRNYTYYGGTAIIAGVPVMIANGSLVMTDNAVNYVERTYDGVVSVNTVGFTFGAKVPLAKVTAAAGAITVVEDWRPMFGPFAYYPTQAGEISVTDVRYPYYNALRYGAIGNGASHPLSGIYGTLAAAQAVYPHATALTDELDWAAIQAACENGRAQAKGAVVALPTVADSYICNKQVTSYAKLAVEGQGSARDKAVVKFTGAGSDGFVCNGQASPGFVQGGRLQRIYIFGANANGNGVNVSNVGSFQLIEVTTGGAWNTHGCWALDCDHMTVHQCNIGGGSAATAAMLIDASPAFGGAVAGFYIRDSYISGQSNAVACALQLDRCATVTVEGGTISVAQTLVKIGASATGNVGDQVYASQITFIGVGLERPVGGTYVDIGSGWVNWPGFSGVRGVTFKNCSGTASASTTYETAFKVSNTYGLSVLGGVWVLGPAGTGAMIDLIGTHNQNIEYWPGIMSALAGSAGVRDQGTTLFTDLNTRYSSMKWHSLAILNGPSLGTTITDRNALIRATPIVAAGGGNSVFFGHSNTEYLATLGAYSAGGQPFIAFYAYHGTTANTLKRASAANQPAVLEVSVGGLLTWKVAPAGVVDANIADFATVFTMSAAGVFNLIAGGSLQFGGTKVLGARGAAVADVASANATDLPSVIALANESKAQLNSWLARARAATGHGLIA